MHIIIMANSFWGYKILDKLMLSEEDYEYLTKGIAIGVGAGIFIGAITEQIILVFAAGGIIGMICGLIYSKYKKLRIKREK